MLLSLAEASVKLKVPPSRANLGDDCKNNCLLLICMCICLNALVKLFCFEVGEHPSVALLDQRREERMKGKHIWLSET